MIMSTWRVRSSPWRKTPTSSSMVMSSTSTLRSLTRRLITCIPRLARCGRRRERSSAPDALDQLLGLADVPGRRGAKDDGLEAFQAAYPFDGFIGRNRPRGKDGHGDRPTPPGPERFEVRIDAAGHAKADLVDVATDDRVLYADLVERVEEQRQVHGDEARLGPVALPHILVELCEDGVQLHPEQEVGDDVLHEDHRRVQAFEALHFAIDEQPHQYVDVPGQRPHGAA